MNNRNKILKRNFDEAEEEIQMEKTQKRKAQREMEDMLEAQETLNRELNSLKSKLRWEKVWKLQLSLSLIIRVHNFHDNLLISLFSSRPTHLKYKIPVKTLTHIQGWTDKKALIWKLHSEMFLAQLKFMLCFVFLRFWAEGKNEAMKFNFLSVF